MTHSIDIEINGKSKQVESGKCLSDLLEQLELLRQPIAVELNLQLIPRAQHGETVLADGDKLEIVTLVGGG